MNYIKRKKSSRLKVSYSFCFSVGMTRLELATTRPPDAYANQLRHIPKKSYAKILIFFEIGKQKKRFFVNLTKIAVIGTLGLLLFIIYLLYLRYI